MQFRPFLPAKLQYKRVQSVPIERLHKPVLTEYRLNADNGMMDGCGFMVWVGFTHNNTFTPTANSAPHSAFLAERSLTLTGYRNLNIIFVNKFPRGWGQRSAKGKAAESETGERSFGDEQARQGGRDNRTSDLDFSFAHHGVVEPEPAKARTSLIRTLR